MNTDINLLLRKDDESLRRLRKAKILKLIAIILAIVIGALSFFVFILIQVINPPSIKKEQDETLRKMSQFQKKQAKLFILNDRIDNVAEILKKRKDLPKAVNTLLAKTPNLISIENLEIDDKFVVMVAYSTSLSAIGEFINNLTDMVRKKEIISSLTLNTLVFDEGKNNYSFSIKAEL